MPAAAAPGSGQLSQSQADPDPSTTPISWEGDKMFNIYIYDYCTKRGYRKTARELLTEAEIPLESTPPINARQGLLFEWWSVFWVLFQAKSSGQGREDAMLYTQYQIAQQANRQQAQRMQASSGPTSIPMGPQSQPQQSSGPLRLMNGMGMNRQGGNFLPNGPPANGVGPGPMSGPPSGQPGPLTSFPMGGPGSQSNGQQIAQGMSSMLGQTPAQPQQNYTSLLPGQRAPLNAPPQRLSGPFQSPTMAHSPHNNGVGPTGSTLQPPHAPMGQLGAGPHISPMQRGGMHPQNGQGINMVGAGQQPVNASTPGYQRPPSRTNTPGQGGAVHQSPSLTARQPSGNGLTQTNASDGINAEIMGIPSSLLSSLMQEIGIGGKDSSALTQVDKQRILTLYHQRIRSQKQGENATAGPSNLMNAQQRNLSQQLASSQAQQLLQQAGQGQQNHVSQTRVKRSSTSPGEEPETHSSPPDRKRVRRSPMGPQQAQLNLSQQMPHSQQQGQQPGVGSGPPQNQPSALQGMGPQVMQMRGVPIGMPGVMGSIGINPGMPQGGQLQPGPMNMGGMGQQQMMPPGQYGMAGGMPHVSPSGYRGQSLHTIHKALSTGPNKPMGNVPAMNGPKDQTSSGLGKDNKIPTNTPGGHTDGSPRPPQQVPGTAPHTPVPTLQQQQNENPSQQQPQQNSTTGQHTMTSSPSSMMPSSSVMNVGPSAMPSNNVGRGLTSAGISNTGPSSGGLPSTGGIGSSLSGVGDTIDPSLFPPDFMQDFDPTMFQGNGDINFERDFGQWFNPDDVAGLDGIK